VAKTGQRIRRRKPASLKVITWIVLGGLVALVAYAATEFSGITYGESALGVVNFSELNSSQKRRALKDANQARCNCGCGMTLAQCVATDSTVQCATRTSNASKQWCVALVDVSSRYDLERRLLPDANTMTE
jgi:hypothetical protein